jgi:two-component system sensor histidine kinase KdpD
MRRAVGEAAECPAEVIHGAQALNSHRFLSPSRVWAGVALGAVLLVAVTVLGVVVADGTTLATALALYLLSVVLVSLVGGFVPSVASAIAGGLLLNYYFAPPLHSLAISRGENIVAIVVFVVVAVLVSRVVDLAARRSDQAALASSEAETLSVMADSVLRGEQAIPALLRRVRDNVRADAVSLLREDAGGWQILDQVGDDPPATPDQADAVASAVPGQVLALRGRDAVGRDRRLLRSVAAHLAVAQRQRELSLAAAALGRMTEADRQRATLLNAVSHDLRTPLASAKAAVSTLRSPDIGWTPAEQAELLGTADAALDRVTDLVANLLDYSRLQAGVLPVFTQLVGLDDVVARALTDLPATAPLDVDVAPDQPEVSVDPGLLERVVANLVQNALRFAPSGTKVRIQAGRADDHVVLQVIDHGAGIPAERLEAVFDAFRRFDDHPNSAGLGLTLVRGFTEAMGGQVSIRPTPGGGATFELRLATRPGPEERLT